MKINSLFLFLTLLVLISCSSRQINEIESPKPIVYSVIQKSPYFNKKNIAFTIDSLNNCIQLYLTLNELKDFPYPINKQFKDTLAKTAFNFDFYNNGKLLQTDYKKIKNTLRWVNDSSKNANNLSLSSDTISLKSNNTILIEVPFYAFHNLKKGKQIIELSIYQTIFTDEFRDDSSEYHHLYAALPLLNTKVKFEIDMPAIYQSIVYGMGLELRNDSTFSPAGMDNTLFQSSYPDIYWTIFYPGNSWYAQTPYENSTDRYVAHDTFKLFHYNQNDSIGFGVYDHDNLSRDDGLGYWHGSLNKLSSRPINRLSFDNIKFFDVKVKALGPIN